LLKLAQQGHPFIQAQTAPIDVTCNRFARHILETDYTHLIILGIDHVHPSDLVRKFARHVEAHPDHLVIAAVSYRRGPPYDPLAFIHDNGDIYSVATWEPGEIVQVHAAGTNEMCIHRSVFETLPAPWFYRDYTVAEDGLSEDLVFCRALKQAGIGIWLDTAITNDHMINGRINEAVYRSYLAQFSEVESCQEFASSEESN
jgi:hypothetical protein